MELFCNKGKCQSAVGQTDNTLNIDIDFSSFYCNVGCNLQPTLHYKNLSLMLLTACKKQ